MKKKETGQIFLKGMAMGLADIVPGVSGGTVALITGIYERLVSGISNSAGILPLSMSIFLTALTTSMMSMPRGQLTPHALQVTQPHTASSTDCSVPLSSAS